ncbi:MAG: GWxTD domain-containing protein [Candidatus Zhuqueibacterota bacterium]
MSKLLPILAWYILLSFAAASARTTQSKIDSLHSAADSLMQKGDLVQARHIFESILKLDDNGLSARAALGKIAYRLEEWGEVKDRFGEILDRDPQNTEAMYYRAISYRESGKFKVLLQRKLDWDKSDRLFALVIERDSLYHDVFLQYALLQRYRERYEQAILLCHKQMKLTPALIEPHVEIFRFYRYLILHRNGKESLAWLESQQRDEAAYAIGEKLRRDGKLDQAGQQLLSLLNQPLVMPRQPIYLALARIHYEKKAASEAEKYFRTAVDEIRDKVDAALVFEDIKYILKDEELSEYKSLTTPNHYRDFIRKLWVSRDPTPAMPTNNRLAEHYRRLLYAEKYYTYDGFRTWFNNPDKLSYLAFNAVYKLNEEYNDKGFIYIRHGTRDDWAATLGEDIAQNESWLYYQTETTPRMTFHFFLENTTQFWRLGPVIIDPMMLEDRFTWGSIYSRMARADPLERLALENEMAEQSKQSVASALASDRHTWEVKIEPLTIPYSGATFRGEDGNTLLEIYYGVPLNKLNFKNQTDDNQIKLETGFSLHDGDWNEVSKREDALFVPATKTMTFIDVQQISVTPDSYAVAFHVRQPETNILGGWKFKIHADDYATAGLAMSEIELALNITPATVPTKFSKHGLNVTPNPASRFPTEKPMNLYFEIYGLTVVDQRSEFSIEYTLTLFKNTTRKFLGLFGRGGKSFITTKMDREGSGEMSVEYLAIDTNLMAAGEYELQVKAIDKRTGESVVRSKKVTLF